MYHVSHNWLLSTRFHLSWNNASNISDATCNIFRVYKHALGFIPGLIQGELIFHHPWLDPDPNHASSGKAPMDELNRNPCHEELLLSMTHITSWFCCWSSWRRYARVVAWSLLGWCVNKGCPYNLWLITAYLDQWYLIYPNLIHLFASNLL